MPAESLTIRRLTPDDSEALGRFFDTVARDETTMEYFRPHELSAEYAALLAGRLSATKDIYFGAFEGSTVVGYGMLRGWDEGFAVPAFGVCVAPDQRGSGLGTALLDYAIQQAKAVGATSVMLKVHRGNHTARALYERAGFEFTGEQTPDGAQEVGRLTLSDVQ